MADRNSNWDREREDWQREDWQRDDAWRRDREHSGRSDRPEPRRSYGQYLPRGDYGPSAFYPGGREQELFGTGSRGYGTTWGGGGVYREGRNLYQGEERTYPEGEHAGKGPKGYQRSDDRIREDVCEVLTRHGQVDAREIEIQVTNGEVTLKGTVERREEKRIAEDAADRVAGVRDVHNQLRIQPRVSAQSPTEQQFEPTGAGNRRR